MCAASYGTFLMPPLTNTRTRASEMWKAASASSCVTDSRAFGLLVPWRSSWPLQIRSAISAICSGDDLSSVPLGRLVPNRFDDLAKRRDGVGWGHDRSGRCLDCLDRLPVRGRWVRVPSHERRPRAGQVVMRPLGWRADFLDALHHRTDCAARQLPTVPLRIRGHLPGGTTDREDRIEAGRLLVGGHVPQKRVEDVEAELGLQLNALNQVCSRRELVVPVQGRADANQVLQRCQINRETRPLEEAADPTPNRGMHPRGQALVECVECWAGLAPSRERTKLRHRDGSYRPAPVNHVDSTTRGIRPSRAAGVAGGAPHKAERLRPT